VSGPVVVAIVLVPAPGRKRALPTISTTSRRTRTATLSAPRPPAGKIALRPAPPRTMSIQIVMATSTGVMTRGSGSSAIRANGNQRKTWIGQAAARIRAARRAGPKAGRQHPPSSRVQLSRHDPAAVPGRQPARPADPVPPAVRQPGPVWRAHTSRGSVVPSAPTATRAAGRQALPGVDPEVAAVAAARRQPALLQAGAPAHSCPRDRISGLWTVILVS
jgi:hypothetical protein